MAKRLPTTPTFVLPYKRFAAPCLIDMSESFLHDPHTTYRKSVLHDRCQIGYPIEQEAEAVNTGLDGTGLDDTEQDSAEQDESSFHQSVISPSLVWRFIGWLGALTPSLDKAREMILKRNPNSVCHRTSGSIDPGKARSEERLHTLETARQLLLIMPEWEELHGRKFFPRFATRSGFG